MPLHSRLERVKNDALDMLNNAEHELSPLEFEFFREEIFGALIKLDFFIATRVRGELSLMVHHVTLPPIEEVTA